ncbi:hypothetical protein LTR17_027550, partial [Elasticomyces elasticus]
MSSSACKSRLTGDGNGKKRASGAGTPRVITLSATQLERKRVRDRESQRVIRHRIRNCIETLKRTVHDLQGSQESKEKTVAATLQRNRHLEDEVAYLQMKTHGGGCVPATSLIH